MAHIILVQSLVEPESVYDKPRYNINVITGLRPFFGQDHLWFCHQIILKFSLFLPFYISNSLFRINFLLNSILKRNFVKTTRDEIDFKIYHRFQREDWNSSIVYGS